jgi:hypothetical protein
MIEVLKQVVEALEYHVEQTRPISKTKEAIQAGKQAIAELESQEPVKYEHKAYTMPPQPEQKTLADDFFKTIADKNPKPFPSPQRTWVGLTDEERIDILVDAVHTKWDDQEIIKAIEAKLKQKNSYAEDSLVTEQNICPKCRSFFCDHTCKTNPEEKNNA